jgi:hypothetical protein
VTKPAGADKTSQRYSIESGNCQEREKPDRNIVEALHQKFCETVIKPLWFDMRGVSLF